MLNLEFEWDETKNAVNLMKHGVSFETAKKVFFDTMGADQYDWDHSLAEERRKMTGIAGWLLLTVSYTEEDDRIRIISARKANKLEEALYNYGYGTGYGN